MSWSVRDERRSPALTAGLLAGGFVVVLWLLEIVDTVADHRLDEFGISPREGEGLVGVVGAPLLHSGFGHLVANTVPVLVLGFLVLVSGVARGLVVTGIVWVVAGIGVWLVAPPHTLHLGASSLVFGWLAYLIVRGFWSRRPGEIVLGVVIVVLYGGTLLGVLPGQPGVSWQGHLFGAIGGVAAAALVRPERRLDS